MVTDEVPFYAYGGKDTSTVTVTGARLNKQDRMAVRDSKAQGSV